MKFQNIKTWNIRAIFALSTLFFSLTAQNAYANCVREEYTVKRGDTLSTIVNKKMEVEKLKPGHNLSIYGKKGMIQRIFNLNHKKVSNPDLIFPGEVIVFPEEITPSFASSLECPRSKKSEVSSDSGQTTPSQETTSAPTNAPATEPSTNPSKDTQAPDAAAPAKTEDKPQDAAPSKSQAPAAPAPASVPAPAAPAPDTGMAPPPAPDANMVPPNPAPDTAMAPPPIPPASIDEGAK